jgi:hypothetical protein
MTQPSPEPVHRTHRSAGGPSDALGLWLLDDSGLTRKLLSRSGEPESAQAEARLLATALLQCAGQYVVTARWSDAADDHPDIGEIAQVRQLRRIAAALGTPLLDHIVVNTAGHFSLREHGLM